MFLVWFVILKCSENLCCISTAFDDFFSFCLLCSFQGTPDLAAVIPNEKVKFERFVFPQN